MKNKILVLFFIVVCLQLVNAQVFNKQKLDDYFTALDTNNKFMGSVAVMQDGKLIYTNSIGYVDVASALKSNAETKYRIGSITKTFTTVLVFKAIEEKKLKLNQTINKWFPDIKNAKKITVQHLLSHRSGIHNFTDDTDYLQWSKTAKTEEELIGIIVKIGSDFQPGSKAEYSNSNFVLLTFILEKTFAKPYAQLVSEYITQPAGLTNTEVGGLIKNENNESNSYTFSKTWNKESETDMSIPLGAGAIISTPTDLVKFSDALFAGKLVKTESLALMTTIQDNYGLGLFPMPFYTNKGFGHTGGIDGFSSMFCHFNEGNVSYALTSNGSNYSNNNIGKVVLSAVYDKPYEIPSFIQYQPNETELIGYSGVYSSKRIPMKITISRENNGLIAQATGQSSFPLEPLGKDEFQFEEGGIKISFNTSSNKLVLAQGGAEIEFTKE